MKENPNPHLDEADQGFKGDNFVKMTGDYISFVQNEGFMVEANNRAKD